MFILVIEQIAKTGEKTIGRSICDILRDLVPLVQDTDTSFKKGLMELGSILETSFEIYLNNLQYTYYPIKENKYAYPHNSKENRYAYQQNSKNKK